MYYNRPSFKRGGPTGIAQLTPRRQGYAGGGNIGGGIISGSNLGTRSGFVSPNLSVNFPGFEYLEEGIKQDLRSQMKPSSGKGLTDGARGSARAGTRGARLATQLRNLAIPSAKTAAGTMGIPVAAVYGLAQMNKAKTLEGLNYMKDMDKTGIFEETAGVDDFTNYGNTLREIDSRPGGKKITLTDNFFMDKDGLYPKFLGSSADRAKRAELTKLRAAETDIEDGITNYENDEVEAAEQKSALDSAIETILTDKKEDPKKDPKETPKEPSFEDSYKTEFDRINKLIGDDTQKGMAAIALSEAIGTPGTIADKAAVLNKSLLGIMQGKKKDKKQIAMLAYKATKEIEKAKILAGKKTDSAKNFEELKTLNRIIKDDTGTYNEDQKKNAQSKINVIEASINSLNPAKTQKTLDPAKAVGTIEEFNKSAKKLAKMDKNDPDYARSLENYKAFIELLTNYPELMDSVKRIDASTIGALGKKDGGRIERALGSPETGEVGTMPISQTTNNSEVPTAQVSNLSFKELRDRLPPEVTDDVIRFLTQSNQALQDFAYIRTAGDIKKFNMKYGLNLVLPAQQA